MMKEIHAKATAGVYSEVMNQIYDSFDKRIREAISNATDAKATKVTISVFLGNETKMIIRDNGYGMTADDIETALVSMGGGDKYNDEDSIGRIGIGALSIFAIGNEVTINTRRKGDKTITIAELKFNELQRAAKHSTPLDQIVLGHIKPERAATDEDEEHFTEIVISDLNNNVVSIFNDERKTKGLIETLERILPVPYRNDDPIFEKLPSQIRNRLTSDKHIEEITLHIPHLGYTNPDYIIRRKTIESIENVKIINYLPIFPFNLGGGTRSNLNVCGYLFINDGKVLPKRWQGINARVKNVTIESNTYFGYEDDPASRNRIGGELIISNIDENRAITTNRSGFATENIDYTLISKYMQERILNAADIVRKHSAIDSLVKKYVNSIERLMLVFRKNAAIQDEREDNGMFKALDDKSIQLKASSDYSLMKDLKEEFDKLHVEFELIWSGTMEDNYYILPQEDRFYSIYVHENLHRFNYNVAGNMVEYFVAYCGEKNPLLIKKPGKVFLNLDNKLVRNKDINQVDVGLVATMLILYLNYLRCQGNATLLYFQTIEDLLKT
jgi:hypothetical protein